MAATPRLTLPLLALFCFILSISRISSLSFIWHFRAFLAVLASLAALVSMSLYMEILGYLDLKARVPEPCLGWDLEVVLAVSILDISEVYSPGPGATLHCFLKRESLQPKGTFPVLNDTFC